MRPETSENSTSNRLYLGIALGLIAFAVIMRLLPHPANFTPVMAIAIFGGAVLPRRWALALPLAVMVISDLVIGMHSLVLLTWGSFAVVALFSMRVLSHKITPLKVIGASLGASVLFYLVTNFGVWAEGRMYPMTLAGLMESYALAIPFFRNMLIGDLLYSSALFGAYAAAKSLTSSRLHIGNQDS